MEDMDDLEAEIRALESSGLPESLAARIAQFEDSTFD